MLPKIHLFALGIGAAMALAAPTQAAPNPYNKPDDSWISLTGTVSKSLSGKKLSPLNRL